MEEKIRLNKLLSDYGVCSRREADRLVEGGKVTVDGKPAVLGMKVSTGQTIICDGKQVETKKKKNIVIVFNLSLIHI